MRRYVKILLSLMLLVPIYTQAQQEVQMSQYMFNGIVLNPSLAGGRETFNAQLLYRQQWVGIDNAPKTIIGSIDGNITRSGNMGLGLTFYNDNVGIANNTGGYLSYSFRIKLNDLDDRLSFGVSAGLDIQQFKGADLFQMAEDGSPIYAPDDILLTETAYKPDFKVGLFYSRGKSFYAGASLTKIGTFFTDTINNPHVYLNVGGNIWLGQAMALKPSLLYGQAFKGNGTLDVSLALSIVDRIWVGASVRLGTPSISSIPNQGNIKYVNSISAMAEIWVTRTIRLGYCFDYGLNRISGIQNGTHEVSLGVTLQRSIKSYRNPRDF
ncbi:MAG: type IX secretion system membrane protein PorP/SprF [Prevotellaceae bacterium]|nr:type IX secretion system membrane protein PorP/SprF [Prevotellaceae bacterium]